MTSSKWKLIWQDIKSWLVSVVLMFGPLVLISFLQLLLKQDYGSYSLVVALALGSLLKLAQKWEAVTTYVDPSTTISN